MRDEGRKIATAFDAGKPAQGARTTTNGAAVYLHGNRIAWKECGRWKLTLAGWPTVTTRSRLNDLCEFVSGSRPFSQKRGVQYFFTPSSIFTRR
jgi:hypothetical protein